MKKLILDDGLLLTDMELIYNGRSLVLKNVLVDTGSGGTIVSSDLVEKIGIIGEESDTIYRISGVGGSEFVFSKKVDSIKIGNLEVNEFFIEVGAMNYGFDLDGIIGLDFLIEVGAIINLEKLMISKAC
jgi:predicted aspartyl protease